MAKVIALTLPGAVLWSVPIGIWAHQEFGSPWVGQLGARFFGIEVVFTWTALLGCSVICNICAIVTCIRTKPTPPGVKRLRVINALLAIVSAAYSGLVLFVVVARFTGYYPPR